MIHGFNSTASLSYVNSDGTLDFDVLFGMFAKWWADTSDLLIEGEELGEGAAQVILTAFLDRIAPNGGLVDRDYAVGRDSVDIFVRWPYTDAGRQRLVQREVIEVEVRRPRASDPLSAALAALDEHLARLGLDAATLLIFDRDLPADQTGRSMADTPAGRSVTVWRV